MTDSPDRHAISSSTGFFAALVLAFALAGGMGVWLGWQMASLDCTIRARAAVPAHTPVKPAACAPVVPAPGP